MGAERGFLRVNPHLFMKTTTILTLSALAVGSSQAAVIWNAGRADNLQQYTGAPANQGPGGGGEDARFIQEAGGQTALPGSATNTGGEGAGRDIDDDYYFAGDYSTTIGNAYVGLGIVGQNEENMERAFTHPSAGAGGDRNLRYHFNFPASTLPTDLISVNFGITGMEDIVGADGWDVELKVNGVSIYTQGVDAVANADFSSPTFNLAAIGATAGAGFDNYVELTGTSRTPADGRDNAGNVVVAGGSRWLSIDYVEMDVSPDPIPEPSSHGLLLLALGGLGFIRRRK